MLNFFKTNKINPEALKLKSLKTTPFFRPSKSSICFKKLPTLLSSVRLALKIIETGYHQAELWSYFHEYSRTKQCKG